MLGFARSDASAAALDAAGAEVHRGALEDLDSLKRGAQACDGVIHTAFIRDWSQFMTNVETDRRPEGPELLTDMRANGYFG